MRYQAFWKRSYSRLIFNAIFGFKSFVSFFRPYFKEHKYQTILYQNTLLFRALHIIKRIKFEFIIPVKLDEINISIGESLRNKSWWMGNLFPKTLLRQLNTDARMLSKTQQFTKAATGASHAKLIDTKIRGDQTYWLSEPSLEPPNLAQLQISIAMLSLKDTFENYFPILLNNFEGHYSHYPAGTFYKKHMDNSRHTNNRVFSVITYFNQNWHEGDGGELVLYSPDNGQLLIEIKPLFGITVIFFSADFPHEVKATVPDRYSLTGWFTHK